MLPLPRENPKEGTRYPLVGDAMEITLEPIYDMFLWHIGCVWDVGRGGIYVMMVMCLVVLG